ncbi:hypothetical protein GQ53DRAFT_819984 [Thozetella sp. PMI_491]|nr:hypothetical protein GQ53DRAFT_819984 [Thozetella sp. PMI_491]
MLGRIWTSPHMSCALPRRDPPPPTTGFTLDGDDLIPEPASLPSAGPRERNVFVQSLQNAAFTRNIYVNIEEKLSRYHSLLDIAFENHRDAWAQLTHSEQTEFRRSLFHTTMRLWLGIGSDNSAEYTEDLLPAPAWILWLVLDGIVHCITVQFSHDLAFPLEEFEGEETEEFRVHLQILHDTLRKVHGRSVGGMLETEIGQDMAMPLAG